MRSTNPATSSSAKALSSESIGTRWRTFLNVRTAWRRHVSTGCRGGPGSGSGFDRGVALAQRVVVGVGDRRRVFLVVRDVVLGDLGGEAFELGGGFGLREVIDGCGGVGSPGLRAHRLRILWAAALEPRRSVPELPFVGGAAFGDESDGRVCKG